MGYIGGDINYGNIAKQVATSPGGGSTTPTGALTYTVPTSESIMVTLDGVTQVPGTDFNVTGGTVLTFTTSVPADVVVLVYFLGKSLDIGTPADGTVTNAKTDFQPGTTFKGDGASAKGKITINCESNAHGVSIQSPAHSSAATYTLTLPTTDGNANELLKTDGGGVLSWAVDSGGGPSLGTDHIIRTNALTISSPITFAGTENGITYGPITTTALVTVTSPSVWHIL